MSSKSKDKPSAYHRQGQDQTPLTDPHSDLQGVDVVCQFTDDGQDVINHRMSLINTIIMEILPQSARKKYSLFNQPQFKLCVTNPKGKTAFEDIRPNRKVLREEIEFTVDDTDPEKRTITFQYQIENQNRNQEKITQDVRKQLKMQKLKHLSEKELAVLVQCLKAASSYVNDPREDSRKHFEQLIESHIGLGAPPEAKTHVGEQLLKDGVLLLALIQLQTWSQDPEQQVKDHLYGTMSQLQMDSNEAVFWDSYQRYIDEEQEKMASKEARNLEQESESSSISAPSSEGTGGNLLTANWKALKNPVPLQVGPNRNLRRDTSSDSGSGLESEDQLESGENRRSQEQQDSRDAQDNRPPKHKPYGRVKINKGIKTPKSKLKGESRSRSKQKPRSKSKSKSRSKSKSKAKSNLKGKSKSGFKPSSQEQVQKQEVLGSCYSYSLKGQKGSRMIVPIRSSARIKDLPSRQYDLNSIFKTSKSQKLSNKSQDPGSPVEIKWLKNHLDEVQVQDNDILEYLPALTPQDEQIKEILERKSQQDYAAERQQAPLDDLRPILQDSDTDSGSDESFKLEEHQDSINQRVAPQQDLDYPLSQCTPKKTDNVIYQVEDEYRSSNSKENTQQKAQEGETYEGERRTSSLDRRSGGKQKEQHREMEVEQVLQQIAQDQQCFQKSQVNAVQSFTVQVQVSSSGPIQDTQGSITSSQGKGVSNPHEFGPDGTQINQTQSVVEQRIQIFQTCVQEFPMTLPMQIPPAIAPESSQSAEQSHIKSPDLYSGSKSKHHVTNTQPQKRNSHLYQNQRQQSKIADEYQQVPLPNHSNSKKVTTPVKQQYSQDEQPNQVNQVDIQKASSKKKDVDYVVLPDRRSRKRDFVPEIQVVPKELICADINQKGDYAIIKLSQASALGLRFEYAFVPLKSGSLTTSRDSGEYQRLGLSICKSSALGSVPMTPQIREFISTRKSLRDNNRSNSPP